MNTENVITYHDDFFVWVGDVRTNQKLTGYYDWDGFSEESYLKARDLAWKEYNEGVRNELRHHHI